jgi:hypothetical protein
MYINIELFLRDTPTKKYDLGGNFHTMVYESKDNPSKSKYYPSSPYEV